ncbi:MAG: hypothetical protein MJY92_02975 [Bacteroidales bacterium]|nr:hypothetical protein [Bacteroidales bacterium]
MKKLADKVAQRIDCTSRYCKVPEQLIKYNPDFYDEQGRYMADEWDSYFDIGKRFNGQILSAEKYRAVEESFVSAIKDLLVASGCRYVTICLIEDHFTGTGHKGKLAKECQELYSQISQYKEGKRISVNEIDAVIKLCLREQYWCALVNEKKHMHVDFGYDYYVHILSRLSDVVKHEIAKKHGLFIKQGRQLVVIE